MLSVEEFYTETMKASGVTPLVEDLQKVASEKKIDLKVVKLAQEFYNRMLLDKVPHPTDEARAADAMKMAEAYVKQANERVVEAQKIAQDLVRFLEHSVEGFLAQNRIDLDKHEALKIAAAEVVGLKKTANSYSHWYSPHFLNTPLCLPKWIQYAIPAAGAGLGLGAAYLMSRKPEEAPAEIPPEVPAETPPVVPLENSTLPAAAPVPVVPPVTTVVK